MEFKPSHRSKALSPMEVTELGMTVFLQPIISWLSLVLMMALQLSLESNKAFPSSMTICVNLEQLANTELPKEVTVLGNFIDVSLLHPEKA
jgi:uncharacterized protein YqcC (DUF446 family)